MGGLARRLDLRKDRRCARRIEKRGCVDVSRRRHCRPTVLRRHDGRGRAGTPEPVLRFSQQLYALARSTRSDMPVLAPILDKSFAAISARTGEEISRRWMEWTDCGEPTLRSILYYRRWQVTSTGATVFALAAIALLSWRARAAAVRSEREKATFLAFISHEIRTSMLTRSFRRSSCCNSLNSRGNRQVERMQPLPPRNLLVQPI